MSAPLQQMLLAMGAGPTLSFRASGSSTSDLTTYTFAGVDIGTAATNRHVVVGVQGSGGTARTLSSVTVAGVTATILVEATDTGGGGEDHVALVIAAVPTGTTGDVVVTWSGAFARGAYGVWAVYGLESPTPVDTTQSTASPGALSVDTTADSIVIAVSAPNNSSTTAWSGVVTENFDVAAFETQGWTGASAAKVAAATPATVTATYTGGPTNKAAVSIALR